MIGPLLVAAIQVATDVRDALFKSAQARVQRYMVQNVRCPLCLGTGTLPESPHPCPACDGTGLRRVP